MKKIGILILMLILIFMFSVACSDESINTPPEITIKVGETNINYIIGLSTWDGEDYDREDTFNTIIKNDYESLPYIKLFSKIKFYFDEKVIPEKMVIYEYVLDGNGKSEYVNREVLFNMDNGNGSFILDTQIEKLVSSDSIDDVPDATVRGFRLICTWGKNECEYAFIIRTDAH